MRRFVRGSITPNIPPIMRTRRQILICLFILFSAASSSIRAEVPSAVHYKFDVSWSKEKADSKTKGVSHTKITTNTYVTHIKVINLSGQAIPNLELQYQIYYVEAQGTGTVVKHKDAKHVIPLIKPLESVVVDAEPVSLNSKQISAGYHYTSGAPGRQIDTFKGIAASFFIDGKQVYEFVSDGVKKAPQETGKK